ncbi:MAG TPA: hypothetical protein VJA85_06855 [Candidatus Limnocylindria bacterium]|nr:hypothetical protein [Candidatus Limnocylindria bacterium]
MQAGETAPFPSRSLVDETPLLQLTQLRWVIRHVDRAASHGAFSVGATTIGILPGADPDEANEFVTVPIATGLGVVRNLVVVTAADAVLAVGGRHGFTVPATPPAKRPTSCSGLPRLARTSRPRAEIEPARPIWARPASLCGRWLASGRALAAPVGTARLGRTASRPAHCRRSSRCMK